MADATADGTAAAPGDYAAVSGTLTFAPGQTSKTVVEWRDNGGDMSRGIRAPLAIVVVLLVSRAEAVSSRSPRGAVVETVAPGLAGEQAGLRPGDVILSWSRAPGPPANPRMARGEIGSPFELKGIEVEQAPRGLVTLVGLRDGRRSSWAMPSGEGGIEARPTFSKDILTLYQQGLALVASGKVAEGATKWREAAATEQGEIAIFLQLRSAKHFADAKDSDEAYAAAVTAAETAGLSAIEAHALREWGAALQAGSEWDRAADCYARAMALDEKAGSESLTVALSVDQQGVVARSRGDLKSAEDLHRRALAMREKLAPGSLAVAMSLHNLGVVAGLLREDLAAAAEYDRRALAIQEKLAPGSLAVAASLNGLGFTALDLGDLASAEEYLRRALAIQEKRAPESREVGMTLHNVALVALDRGDLAAAEQYLRRALAIKERTAPGSLTVAGTLGGLGELAARRGDLAAAEEYCRRALAIRQDLAPDSLDVTWSLEGLGEVAAAQGDLAAAAEYLRRALAIREKLARESFDVAGTLNALGELAARRGDLGSAEEHQRHALAIQEKLAPGSLDAARSLNGLGEVATSRRDLAAAEGYLRRALAIRAGLAPGGNLQAESLHALGVMYRHGGKAAPAAEYLCRAVDALEQQKTRLGGSQAKTTFAVKYAAYYRDCAEVLVESGASADAMGVLERGRARALLEMLAERDLVFSEIPPDLARERRLTDTEYDRTQEALGQLSPGKDNAEIERLLSRSRELRDKQEQVAAKIRQASPHFAALQYPQPLDVKGIRDALDPGTLLLFYSVNKDSTLLFAAQPAAAPPGLSVWTLPVGEEALRLKVAAFRNVIRHHRAEDRDTLARRGAELYDLLVRPAEPLFASSQRILLCPDGPLHTLCCVARPVTGIVASRMAQLVRGVPRSVPVRVLLVRERNAGA